MGHNPPTISAAQLWAMDGTTIVGSAAGGRGPEPRDPPILTQEITPQGPSPVTHDKQTRPIYWVSSAWHMQSSRSIQMSILLDPLSLPLERAAASLIRRAFSRKGRTNHASEALKTPITRGRERDSNMEWFDLITPWRSPGL